MLEYWHIEPGLLASQLIRGKRASVTKLTREYLQILQTWQSYWSIFDKILITIRSFNTVHLSTLNQKFARITFSPLNQSFEAHLNFNLIEQLAKEQLETIPCAKDCRT